MITSHEPGKGEEHAPCEVKGRWGRGKGGKAGTTHLGGEGVANPVRLSGRKSHRNRIEIASRSATDIRETEGLSAGREGGEKPFCRGGQFVESWGQTLGNQ